MGIIIILLSIWIIFGIFSNYKRMENIHRDFENKRKLKIEQFCPDKIIEISNKNSHKPCEFLINSQDKKFAILYFEIVDFETSKLFKRLCRNEISKEEFERKKQELLTTGNNLYMLEYNFSDLIDYELLESTDSKLQGKGLVAASGAMLFGTVGAIVATNILDRKISKDKSFIVANIHVNNLQIPFISFEFFNKNNQLESDYNNSLEKAKEFIATLDYIKFNSSK